MSDIPENRTLSRLGELILVRLLAGGKPPGRAEIDKALKRFVADAKGMAAAEWRSLLDQTLAELQQTGLIEPRPYRLTEQGQAHAIAFLSAPSLPPGSSWPTLRNRYLTARALGIQPQTKAEWERLGTADGLRAAVLAKHYGLPLGAVPTVARALHALAWKQLEEAHDLEIPAGKDFSRNNVLQATLMKDQLGKPEERLPALVTGAARDHPDAIREAVICRWLDAENVAAAVFEAGGPEPEPFDLAGFASKVRQLAGTSPTGRYGEHKVFISHVWGRFRQDPASGGMTREEFDRQLVEANRRNLLTLSRADLVDAMDPADVQESEIRLSHSTFHFIRTDR
jgi:hypothetical protein